MKLTISIDCDNAAFEDSGPENELARILRDLAARLERDGMNPVTLRDINGNTVGAANFED